MIKKLHKYLLAHTIRYSTNRLLKAVAFHAPLDVVYNSNMKKREHEVVLRYNKGESQENLLFNGRTLRKTLYEIYRYLKDNDYKPLSASERLNYKRPSKSYKR